MLIPNRYEDFKEGFIEYRNSPYFSALSKPDGINRFLALADIVERAEIMLSHCESGDVIYFADSTELLVQEHLEAVANGGRQTKYIYDIGWDDGPSEVFIFKESYLFSMMFTRHSEHERDENQVLWMCRFAALALMKTAKAIDAHSDRDAAEEALQAMDAIGYADLLKLKWVASQIAKRSAQHHRAANARAATIREMQETAIQKEKERTAKARQTLAGKAASGLTKLALAEAALQRHRAAGDNIMDPSITRRVASAIGADGSTVRRARNNLLNNPKP